MIDWDDAFANSAYIPRAADIYASWVARSEALRASRKPDEIRYGPDPREVMDLFLPDGAAQGLLVFVHGGYWHELDKSSWSFLVQGPLAHGYAVAVPSYPLAPDVGLPTIAQAVAKAIAAAAARVDGPLYLAGHSAGGHLVLRMVCDDALLPQTLMNRVARVTSISGVHDLRPLLQTKMNDILKLLPETARDESPALRNPLNGPEVGLWVGAAERPEFLRQTRLMGEAWAAHITDETYEPGRNHFTVLDSLADPNGPLCRAVLGLT